MDKRKTATTQGALTTAQYPIGSIAPLLKKKSAANSPPEAPEPEKMSRRRRSRENTRQKLIAAAQRVMAEKGVEATTITDITDAADVGVGSFYNHFSSKPEIVECVYILRLKELEDVVDTIMAQESNMAVAIGFIHKMFYERTIADPVWAWFVVHISTSTMLWDHKFLWRASQGVADGIQKGTLSVASVEAGARIWLAIVLGTMRSLLEGTVTPKVANDIVEATLCSLGVPRTEARAIAQRRLPKYITSMFKDVGNA